MDSVKLIKKILDYGYVEDPKAVRYAQIVANTEWIEELLNPYGIKEIKDNNKAVIFGIAVNIIKDDKYGTPIIYLSNKVDIDSKLRSYTYHSLYDIELEAVVIINKF